MNLKLLRGTVFGGIAFSLLRVIFRLLLLGYYSANTNQCFYKPPDDLVWWTMILSNIVLALLISIILNWKGARGILDGLKTGAVFGFLYSLALDLGFSSATTMFNNFGAILVDIIVNTVYLAIGGLIIVLVWGKDKAD